jgi:hypothetical protein
LENVTGLTYLYIQNNPELESMTGLVLEGTIDFVTIGNNAALRDLTSLTRLREVRSLEIAFNPQLTESPAFAQLTSMTSFVLTTNAALRAVPEFPLITEMVVLGIRDNAALERFNAFPALGYVESLEIFGNPNLVEVRLPQLSEADAVYIHYNEQLDGEVLAASLAGISARTLRVAPDQTQLELDPCPWTTDPMCDEGYMCAQGTDPSCRSF